MDKAQISYAATSPDLSGPEYSLLARTPPVDSAEMEGQVMAVRVSVRVRAGVRVSVGVRERG